MLTMVSEIAPSVSDLRKKLLLTFSLVGLRKDANARAIPQYSKALRHTMLAAQASGAAEELKCSARVFDSQRDGGAEVGGGRAAGDHEYDYCVAQRAVRGEEAADDRLQQHGDDS